MMRFLRRFVKAEPSPAEIAAEARAASEARERAMQDERERASKEWEERQRQAHRDWIAAAQADMALRAERARREGCDNVGFVHAGEIPTITVDGDEWVSLDDPRRRWRWGR
jgi:uncharacterized protein YaiL (DUF2058 family)